MIIFIISLTHYLLGFVNKLTPPPHYRPTDSTSIFKPSGPSPFLYAPDDSDRATHLSGLAVDDGNIFLVLQKPVPHVPAKVHHHRQRGRIVVLEGVLRDDALELRGKIFSLQTSGGAIKTKCCTTTKTIN